MPLTELFGFPPSGTISPSVRLLEKDLSYYDPGTSFSKAALIGFASKGPLNTPTQVFNHEDLYRKFGYPDPTVDHGSYLIYAAIEFLKFGTEAWILRVGVADESDWDNFAKTAYVEIPAAGKPAVLRSDLANTTIDIVEDYNDKIRFAVNNGTATRTFQITAGEYYLVENELDTDASNLVDTINTIATVDDGFEAYEEDSKLAFRTTRGFGAAAAFELVSVIDGIYNITGLAKENTMAEITGANTQYPADSSVSGFDFSGLTNPTLKIRVNGTGAVAIDNVIQTIPFDQLVQSTAITGLTQGVDRPVGVFGPIVTATVVVAYINWFVDNIGTHSEEVYGGFYAEVGTGADIGKVKMVTRKRYVGETPEYLEIAGDDALLQVRYNSQFVDTVLGLDNNAVTGSTFSAVSTDALIAGGTTLVDLDGDGTASDIVYIDDLGKAIGSEYAAGAAPTILTIWAESPGLAGNGTQVVLTTDPIDGVLALQIYNGGIYVEGHGNLNLNDTAVNNKYYIEDWINGYSDYMYIEHDASVASLPLAATYDLGATTSVAGSDGYPYDTDGLPDATEIDALVEGSARLGTGTYAIAEPEKIDIDLVAAPALNSTDVMLALIDLCEIQRRDCMAILDTPYGLTSVTARKWHNGDHPLNATKLDSSYAALYWPWVKVRDTTNNVDVWVPPTGNILGVYAQSENISAVWYAPAGLRRGGIPTIREVETYAYLGERDTLYGNRNAVNVIVPFPIEGPHVWGNKTLQRRPTALDRVSVRRLMLYVEKRMQKGSKDLLFEPHTVELRQELINKADALLSPIVNDGGIYDYFIKCDEELNTAEVIDRNEMRARIGIQPVKAAEFIFIEFTINRTDSFEESVL